METFVHLGIKEAGASTTREQYLNNCDYTPETSQSKITNNHKCYITK